MLDRAHVLKLSILTASDLHVLKLRWLLGYPVVYLVEEKTVDKAAASLSSSDAVLTQFHIPCLVSQSHAPPPLYPHALGDVLL